MTPRLTQLLIFISIALSILGGLHYYFWARLVRDTALPSPYRQLATLSLIALGLSMPLAMVLARSGLTRALSWPAFVWMGFMFLLFVALLGTDVVRLVIWLGGVGRPGAGPIDPARRLYLARVLGGTAAAVAASFSLIAMRSALGRIATKELEITLDRLPPPLDGTTLVQLSDIHVGPTIGRAFIEELVRRTNELNPDVVAITGDLVDGSVAELRDSVAPLKDLRARFGVYFVTGNHEYYSGVEEWLQEISRLQIRVLRNERVPIGEGAHGFDLAGIDDFHAHGQAPGHGPDLERALLGRDPARAVVLLAHQPRAIHEAAALGVSLQLSGHTHGGQIWPFNYMVHLQQPYVAGLAREGETQLYVSRGTGYWGPPMRLKAPAEITKIVLRARGKITET
jgi:predicted MPP superfamily phosphohydrolase